MPYEPVRGTVPFKVIEHLRSKPEGTELSLTEVAIACLEWESARGLKSWLTPAVEGGALAFRTGGQRQTFVRLGDGKDQFARTDDPIVTKMPAAAVSSVFAYAEQRQAAPFATLESSDGRLVIQRHGRVIAELTPEEAAEHRRFLKAQADAKLREEVRRLQREIKEAAQPPLFQRETT